MKSFGPVVASDTTHETPGLPDFCQRSIRPRVRLFIIGVAQISHETLMGGFLSHQTLSREKKYHLMTVSCNSRENSLSHERLVFLMGRFMRIFS